jgi:hypothetical protein
VPSPLFIGIEGRKVFKCCPFLTSPGTLILSKNKNKKMRKVFILKVNINSNSHNLKIVMLTQSKYSPFNSQLALQKMKPYILCL